MKEASTLAGPRRAYQNSTTSQLFLSLDMAMGNREYIPDEATAINFVYLSVLIHRFYKCICRI